MRDIKTATAGKETAVSAELSFKRTYIARAQSPMLHFQHRQKGATLRASEVKPALDRFLIQKLEGKVDVSPWFGRRIGVFDYRLRFTSWGLQKRFEPPRIFYANLNEEEDKKIACVFGDCRVEVVCFIPELLEQIDRYIGEFFLCHNFGRMKSKGFGSFVIIEKMPSIIKTAEILTDYCGAKECYAIRYDSGSRDRVLNNMFSDISKLYGVMKSGMNLRFGDKKTYCRSYLFRYCHEVLGIGNEKAAMKKEKVSPWDGEGPVKHPENTKAFSPWGDEDFYYVRGLLGVGIAYKYIAKFGHNPERGYFPINSLAETISIQGEQVERLASPIFFKIIGNVIYLLAKRINPIIFGESFTFCNKTTEQDIKLRVPNDFDIDHFLAWFVKRYNEEANQKNEKGEIPFFSIQKPIEKIEPREEGAEAE